MTVWVEKNLPAAALYPKSLFLVFVTECWDPLLVSNKLTNLQFAASSSVQLDAFLFSDAL